MNTISLARSCLSRLKKAFLVLVRNDHALPRSTYSHFSISFAQEGEDGVLQRLFERKAAGFYVDVGSHHPQRFSNTYRFYLSGWNGINIDPLPGSKARFDALRQRDINLELGISDSTGELSYYSFEEPALNTFDPKVAASRDSRLISKDRIQVLRLSDVLDRHLPPNQKIDFLTIDVEGLDLQVLRSNDWSRYRPAYVLAESLGMRDVYQVINSDLHSYMRSQGYSLYAKCVNTLFFIDSNV
jgi:FkbM family methyltransferase